MFVRYRVYMESGKYYIYTKSYGSIEKEAIHFMVEETLEVSMNLNKMVGSRNGREGSYKNDQFEQI